VKNAKAVKKSRNLKGIKSKVTQKVVVLKLDSGVDVVTEC